MGLDMFLTNRIYIGSEYPHRKIVCDINITEDGKPMRINTDKILYITESAGYWRKANHIHQWFVTNIQDGEDNCGEYPVSIRELFLLKQLCLEVLENKSLAPILLPTKSGFFFGSIDYDEHYFKDCEDTIRIIEQVEKSADGELYYNSSW